MRSSTSSGEFGRGHQRVKGGLQAAHQHARRNAVPADIGHHDAVAAIVEADKIEVVAAHDLCRPAESRQRQARNARAPAGAAGRAARPARAPVRIRAGEARLRCSGPGRPWRCSPSGAAQGRPAHGRPRRCRMCRPGSSPAIRSIMCRCSCRQASSPAQHWTALLASGVVSIQ